MNEIYEVLEKSFITNLDFYCQAIIKYCKLNDVYCFGELNDNLTNKLIENAFLEQEKKFLIKFINEVPIGKSPLIMKTLEFLKILQLKLPIIKILAKEQFIDFMILDALFQIYLKS